MESRFGMFPTYHKEVIDRFSGPAWAGYVEEKMSSRFHNNSIYTQLDLLYEFSQWALAKYRRARPDPHHAVSRRQRLRRASRWSSASTSGHACCG